MKTKLTLVALAATMSLSACYTHESHNSWRNNKNDMYIVRVEDLDRSEVRTVQRSLTEQGFYHGPIDGIWGQQTSNAILDYQTKRHPGQRDVTVDTLQEFGVRVKSDRYTPRHDFTPTQDHDGDGKPRQSG